MRVLAMLVDVAVGLTGFAFAYIIIIFTMFAFQNTSPGYMAKTLPILLIITLLLGTIGGASSVAYTLEPANENSPSPPALRGVLGLD